MTKLNSAGDAENREGESDVEIRRATMKFEVRASDDGKKVLDGYAAVFNTPTVIGDYFIETISPGAFANSLSGDIFALYAHDCDDVLGRTKSGTLKLSEDSHGLKVEIDPPDTQLARDLMVLIERGDVTGMSFGFIAKREAWDETGPMPKRTLDEVELYEVSITPIPAYPTTEIGVRSLDKWRAEKRNIEKPADEPQTQQKPNAPCITASRLRMKHGLRQRKL